MKKALAVFTFSILVSQLSIAQTHVVAVPPSPEPGRDGPAVFAGGNTAWARYLVRNLNANVPKEAQAPPGVYTVKVDFMIDTEGNVSNVEAISVPPLCKPCGAEAERIIRSSPKWTPATQGGKAVFSKKTQSISFRTSSDTAYKLLAAAPVLVPFEHLSLRDAIQKAASTGKIVLAQFVSDKCDCNDAADMAMKSAQLAAVVKDKCIPILIDIAYTDRKEFIDTYNPGEYIGTYFISGDADLLSRFPRVTNRPSDYIAEIYKAVSKQMEGRVTLKELDEEWKTNPENIMAMEMNLQKRLAAGLKTDSLLDIYVNRLPPDSLKSKRVLQFIASQAPSLFSKASQAIRKDYPFFEQMWFEMPVATRNNINGRIAHKSLHNAIDAKSPAMAYTVASFISKTFYDTTKLAHREYDRVLLAFYRGTRDTAKALSMAMQFYDNHVMTINPRMVHLTDSINSRKAFDTTRVERVEDPIVPGKFVTTRSVLFRPASGFFAAELTQGAALVYVSTNNPAYLQKALSWAKRAREFSNFVDVQNTYAKLLYVTGNKAEAIASEKETIHNLRQVGRNTKTQENILLQMEANEKLKDRL